MKKIFILLFLLLCVTLSVQGNPIMPAFFSEIYFDDNDDWTIELYDYYQLGIYTLDDCYIGSTTNMAYFNNDIIFTPNDTLVVTNDDMQTDLTINREGDFLVMGGNTYDEMRWGNYQYSNVNAPYPGQSLVRVVVNPDDPYFLLAKENQPSLGYNPFDAQTYGGLAGYVFDENGMPICGLEILISSPIVYITFTNASGFFEINDMYGMNYDLSVSLSGYPSIDTTVTVEPDSTTYVHIFPIYDTDPSPQQKNYSISNHPNPFYDATTILYLLPQRSVGMITIFNSKGQKITEIPVSPAENSVLWMGIDGHRNQVPSGVYFYRLESENTTLASGKMLYLK